MRWEKVAGRLFPRYTFSMRHIDLYAFRHGETDWNKEKRIQGYSDIALNEKGRQQAQQLKTFIQSLNLDIILSSDLKRAAETAQVVSDEKIPIVYNSAFREANLGHCEGKTRDELIKVFQVKDWESLWASWKYWHHGGEDFAFPGGESKKAHQRRLVDGIRSHCLLNPQHNKIGLSTHGGSLLRLFQYTRPESYQGARNCEVWHFQINSNHWNFEFKNSLFSAD